MPNYLIQIYDKYGRLISQTVEKYPSSVGRFQQNKKLDKQDGYRGSYRSKPTKSGLNRKVVRYVATAGDGSKVVSTLIEKGKK